MVINEWYFHEDFFFSLGFSKEDYDQFRLKIIEQTESKRKSKKQEKMKEVRQQTMQKLERAKKAIQDSMSASIENVNGTTPNKSAESNPNTSQTDTAKIETNPKQK